MTPSSTLVPQGLSVFEEKLYRRLADHVSSEADLIASYRELAEAPDTPEAARYLLRLVVDDEERHHRLVREIALALGNGIAWRHDPDAVPGLPYSKPDPALEKITNRFLAAERADRKQLRALRKELRPFRDTTSWSLLIELMEHDTAKHIRLLTFVRDHVARSPRR
jgi:bacterioferritin (cytochrome b1)